MARHPTMKRTQRAQYEYKLRISYSERVDHGM